MAVNTLVSGRKRKTKIKENTIMAAMIERVPGVLSGEASNTGNNCTGINAASHSAPEVNETATPVDIMILVCRVLNGHLILKKWEMDDLQCYQLKMVCRRRYK